MQRLLIKDKGTPTSLHKKGHDTGPLICNYVLNSETNASNGVISVEHRRRRHRPRQHWEKARVATRSMARSAMVGEVAKYSRSEPLTMGACRHWRMKTEHISPDAAHTQRRKTICSTPMSGFGFGFESLRVLVLGLRVWVFAVRCLGFGVPRLQKHVVRVRSV